MKCLITGGTGFVGGHLVEALAARGDEVTCLVRPAADRRRLAALGVRFAEGSLDDASAVEAAVRGQEVVYHVAGVIRTLEEAVYTRINVEGTRRVVEACRRVAPSPGRLVYVSSLAATGPSGNGDPVDEATPCRPVSPYGESKLGGERVVLEAARDLPVAVIRPPVVFGPRDRETLVFFRAIRAGIRPALGRGEWLSFVFVQDLVAGLLLAAGHPAAVGRAWFLCSDGPRTYGEIGRTIAAALGKRWTVPLRVPHWGLVAGAWCMEAAAPLLGPNPMFNRRKVREISQRWWTCSDARARRELGYAPSLGLADGMAATAAWYRAEGWL